MPPPIQLDELSQSNLNKTDDNSLTASEKRLIEMSSNSPNYFPIPKEPSELIKHDEQHEPPKKSKKKKKKSQSNNSTESFKEVWFRTMVVLVIILAILCFMMSIFLLAEVEVSDWTIWTSWIGVVVASLTLVAIFGYMIIRRRREKAAKKSSKSKPKQK